MAVIYFAVLRPKLAISRSGPTSPMRLGDIRNRCRIVGLELRAPSRGNGSLRLRNAAAPCETGYQAGPNAKPLLILELDRRVLSVPREVEMPATRIRHVNDGSVDVAFCRHARLYGLANRGSGCRERMAGYFKRGPVAEHANRPNHLVARVLGMTGPHRRDEDEPNRRPLNGKDIGHTRRVMCRGHVDPRRDAVFEYLRGSTAARDHSGTWWRADSRRPGTG